mgnify:CR=1 FL=1
MTGKILTPRDSVWEKFQGTMHAHLNLRDATLAGEETVIGDCKCNYDITRAVLASHYPEYDIEATIEYFQKNEWLCDCEVYLDSPNCLDKPQE